VRTPELTCANTFVVIFNFEESIFDPEGDDLRGSSSNLISLLNQLTTSRKQNLKKLNRFGVIARKDGESVPIKAFVNLAF